MDYGKLGFRGEVVLIKQQSLDVKSSELSFPMDLKKGSYPWGSYAYANMFSGKTIGTEEKTILIRLSKLLLWEHKIPWLRKKLIPLDANYILHIQDLLRETIYRTNSADVLRAALWQRSAIERGKIYTDDHVLKLIPSLARYIRKIVHG